MSPIPSHDFQKVLLAHERVLCTCNLTLTLYKTCRGIYNHSKAPAWSRRRRGGEDSGEWRGPSRDCRLTDL
ncbi:hypothetical protein E2C01_015637 [Portunus trituberculatus]|uniref:Uncharacterized protein n=1 Tax=Portunus trituberculatus TaxID=210409 RepID=A0A5B7DNH7_PORTR|nr:hypothetical protein [Portunus trituberculatus]